MRWSRIGWTLLALSGCQQAPVASHSALGEPCMATSGCPDQLVCFTDVPDGECSVPCGGAVGCPEGSVCAGDRCQPTCLAPSPCERSSFQCVNGSCVPPSVDGGVDDLTPAAGPDLATPACMTSCAARFGNDGDQEGIGVAFDPMGNIFLVGNYYDPFNLGTQPIAVYGEEDLFLAKLDPSCQPIWSTGFGGPTVDAVTTVAADGLGNVVFTGFAEPGLDFGGGKLPINDSSAFLAKFDGQGNLVFGKAFPVVNSGSRGVGVAVDAANEIALNGFAAGSSDIDFGGGKLHLDWPTSSAYFAKFDPDGGHLWSRVFNPVNPNINVMGTAVAMTPGGVVLGATDEADPVDFGGGPIATPGAAVRLDGGNWIWSSGLPNTNAIASDAQGNAFAAGYVEGDWDFGNGVLKAGGTDDAWLVKLDAATGQTLWSRRFGLAGGTWAESVAAAPDGGVVIACVLTDGSSADFGGGPLTSAGLSDVVLARFDAQGNHVWSARYGDAEEQDVISVAFSPSGQLGVAGFFRGTIDFGLGTGPLTAVPGMNKYDAYVAVLCL